MSRAALRTLAFVLVSSSFTACATLSPGGKAIKYVTRKEAPESCQEVGEVVAGRIVNLFTMKDLINAMRNEAAKLGGNFLVIDDTSYRPNPNGIGGYEGMGRAYECPQEGK